MQTSDVLAKLPEGLIQELIHMMEEGLPGEPGSGNLRDVWERWRTFLKLRILRDLTSR